MRWRVRSILRAQRYHNVTRIINLYNAKLLSYTEYRTAAVYHACVSLLDKIDNVQRSCLNDIGINELIAFMHFNLAPLNLRREIAMLGLIHRTVLWQGPQHFRDFFHAAPRSNHRSERHTRHSCQIDEYRNGNYLAMVKRSLLGSVILYNLLPHEIIDADNIK